MMLKRVIMSVGIIRVFFFVIHFKLICIWFWLNLAKR